MKEETIQRQLEEATRDIERQHREEEERLRAMRQLAWTMERSSWNSCAQQELEQQVVHSGSVNQSNERQQRTPKTEMENNNNPFVFHQPVLERFALHGLGASWRHFACSMASKPL